jgi:hypothetical protein
MIDVRPPLFALLLPVLLGQAAPASADIHKCVDAEGLITFTDTPSRKFKQCTLLYRDPRNVEKPAPAAAERPRATGAARAADPVRANPGPDSFPRVDAREQRERDSKARQIVERELLLEQKLLEDTQRQLAAVADRGTPRSRELQDAASRHERNIREIQRQLASMK